MFGFAWTEERVHERLLSGNPFLALRRQQPLEQVDGFVCQQVTSMWECELKHTLSGVAVVSLGAVLCGHASDPTFLKQAHMTHQHEFLVGRGS
jgi:hypothetical protein